MACRVGVTGQRVADEHCVVALRRKLAVGLVGNLDRGEGAPRNENERVTLVEEGDPPCFDGAEGSARGFQPTG